MHDDSGRAFLERLYDALRITTKAAGRLRDESVLASLLGVKSNVRFVLLTESSLHAGEESREGIAALLRRGYVLKGVDAFKYMISAKGIWDVEQRRGMMTPERLVEYLDSKQFRPLSRSQGLNAKERVIVLGLIAARSFGEAQPIDLHKPESVKEQWKIIFEKSYDLLDELGLVDELSKQDLFGKRGNEHPVSNLVRHTDALKKKTGGIFRALGNQRYTLDVAPDGAIAADRLAFLLGLAIDRQLDIYAIDRIYDASKKIAYDECLLIFDVMGNPYLGAAQDETVRQSFLRAFAPM